MYEYTPVVCERNTRQVVTVIKRIEAYKWIASSDGFDRNELKAMLKHIPTEHEPAINASGNVAVENAAMGVTRTQLKTCL